MTLTQMFDHELWAPAFIITEKISCRTQNANFIALYSSAQSNVLSLKLSFRTDLVCLRPGGGITRIQFCCL